MPLITAVFAKGKYGPLPELAAEIPDKAVGGA
jgi:hypothetical protein